MLILKTCLEQTYNTSLCLTGTYEQDVCLTVLGLGILKSVY